MIKAMKYSISTYITRPTKNISKVYMINSWQHKFKSWTRLIAFPHSTNTLGKGMNPIILLPAMGK